LGEGLSGLVWQTGRAVWVSDVTKDPRASGSSRGPDGKTDLQGGSFVFPVIGEGKTIGVLSFSCGDIGGPDPRLRQAVLVIGSQVGQFLQRKHSVEAHLRHQEKIARFGQSALGKREPPELIADAVQSVLEGLGADAVAYVEPVPASARWWCARWWASRAARRPRRSIVRAACAACTGARAWRAGAARGRDRATLAVRLARELRGALLVPVRGDSGSRGALCALSKGSRHSGRRKPGSLKPRPACSRPGCSASTARRGWRTSRSSTP